MSAPVRSVAVTMNAATFAPIRGLQLQGMTSDPAVLGEDDPAAGTNLGEPGGILCIRGEVIVVDLHASAGGSQRVGNIVCAKRSVDEERQWSVSGPGHRSAHPAPTAVPPRPD